MLERLFAPIQGTYRWLDDHPGARLALGLALFAAAVIAPLPGWALDLWLVVALGSALAMAGLLLVVGDELLPREALAGLPAFLRRFSFHRLALAIALTKAILLGTGAGTLLDWLAQRGLGGNAGVGIAVVAAIYAARFAASHFPHRERLAQALSRYPGEIDALDRAVIAGTLAPQAAKRQKRALTDEIETLGDGREIYHLLRHDSLMSLLLCLGLLAAGLVTGLIFKGWPLTLTVTALSLYGLAEAVLTAVPGLVFCVTLGQWLGFALEEVTEIVREGEAEERSAPGLIVLELGKDLAPAMRRAFPEVVAVVRTRLARELGFLLPRVELLTATTLPPRGYRLVVRGTLWARGELAQGDGVDELGDWLTEAGRQHAGMLTTLDATQAMLDDLANDHPVAVSQARTRHGLGVIHAVLTGLWREQVPVRDLPAVLECLVTAPSEANRAIALIELARRRLSGALTQSLVDERGVVRAMTLGAGWIEALEESADDHALARDLARGCREILEAGGTRPDGRILLLTPAEVRPRVAALLRELLPSVAVVATDELSPRCEVRAWGTVGGGAERRPSEVPRKAPISLLKPTGS